MAPLAEFLERLLYEGKVALSERPGADLREDRQALPLLQQAFSEHGLQVAGPPIHFDAPTALAAGSVVRQACWLLVSHDETEDYLRQHLTMPGKPDSPSQHLSADVVLRFLPQVYRRARAIAPADRLAEILAKILCDWPLSGVLADVEAGPQTALDFGGHLGLMMLYAERLAFHERQAWIPTGGKPSEMVEWIFQGLGKTGV
jgi:hypothetical protein